MNQPVTIAWHRRAPSREPSVAARELAHLLETDWQHSDAMPEVLAAIHACGSLDYSRERALEYARDAEAALSGLDDNAFVAALRGLAHYSVSRDH